MSKSALIIFTKNPELGKCKTRLAATVGDKNALTIYKALIKHTITFTKKLKEVDKYAYYSNEIGGNEFFHEDDFFKDVQKGGDLGLRMYNASKDLFDRGYDKVAIIGSDCYDLNEKILDEAINQLNSHDFVIGPALDGGYYLIGMTKLLPSLFLNKEWSTDTVLKEAITSIENSNSTVYELKALSDIDYEEDLAPELKTLIS